MKRLPETVSPYKRTPEFTETTVPAALLSSHNTKAGVWATIIVLEGHLTYRIIEPTLETIVLSPELSGVVEPTIKHKVEPIGHVRFYVEFYR